MNSEFHKKLINKKKEILQGNTENLQYFALMYSFILMMQCSHSSIDCLPSKLLRWELILFMGRVPYLYSITQKRKKITTLVEQSFLTLSNMAFICD